MNKTITGSWILLLWPFWIVGWGLLVGKIMAKLSNAPTSFHNASMAAVGFANSTGLPLTLTAIIFTSADPTSGLSKTDPTIFISVYLLVYPILQWGLGGWLLEPSESIEPFKTRASERRSSFLQAEDINALVSPLLVTSPLHSSDMDTKKTGSDVFLPVSINDDYNNLGRNSAEDISRKDSSKNNSTFTTLSMKGKSVFEMSPKDKIDWNDICYKFLKQVSQPPIIASLSALVIACIPPLHGVLVDVKDRDDNAPLEWLFDGLVAVGQAAIPINMIMLGCTLSQGISSFPPDFRWLPNLGVALGRLIIVPSIAVLTVLWLHSVLPVKEAYAPSLFFAMLIVSCSPTANNINVMAEIGGVNKDTMALCLLTQYFFAPIVLTFWVAVFTSIVSEW
jgi:predicted permease